MNRREFLGTVATATGTAAVGSPRPVAARAARPAIRPPATGPARSVAQESADAIYRRAVSIDAMCFSMEPPPATFVQYLSDAKIDALRTSGITAMAMNMTSNFAELRTNPNLFQAVLDRIDIWDAVVAENADVFTKVTSLDELDAAKRDGLVGFIYCFQMSSPFGWSLDRLGTYVERGVRQIQLADGNRNFLADTCWEPTNAGLSRFGHEAIAAFNDLGVIVDVSHVGEQSALDAIRASTRPSIYSHSGCYEIAPHPRNVSDRNIRALAEGGGVFCVYNQSGWLTRDPTISIDHFLAHVDRIIDVAGEDHVGVGTDQDAVDMSAVRPTEVADHQRSFDRRRADYPELDWDVHHMRVPDLSHPRRFLHLIEAMLARGYRPSTIEKVVGGNYRRVFAEVVG